MGNVLNYIVFKPPIPSYNINDPHLHMIESPSGYDIAAYFIKHSEARFTIFFSHGNAEDIGHVFHCLIHRLPNWKCNFFIYDYAGYGLSGGTPSEHNVYKDCEVAYEYLVNELGISETDIVAFGRSLGSAPSIHLALIKPLAGLILQCPIASIHRVKLKTLPFTLPGDMFCNIDKVSNIRVPTLILHGTNDDIVSVKASQDMARLIPDAYYHWIEGGMHNDLDFKHVNVMERALQEFFGIIVKNKSLNYVKNTNNCKKSNKFCPLSYCYIMRAGINFI